MSSIFKPNEDAEKYVKPAPAPPAAAPLTTTPNLGLTKPVVGGDADQWGEMINTDLDLIDQKVATITAMNSANAAQDAVIATKADKTYVDSQDSALNTLIGTKAPVDSPNFTGNPLAPTAPDYDNDASLANTAYVRRALGLSGADWINANYTIQASDVGKFLRFGDGCATVTLPLGMPAGFRVDIMRRGSSALNIVATSGAAVHVRPERLAQLPTDCCAATVMLEDAPSNSWVLIGDLTVA